MRPKESGRIFIPACRLFADQVVSVNITSILRLRVGADPRMRRLRGLAEGHRLARSR